MGSRRRCDVAMLDNRSTTYRDVAASNEPLPRVTIESAGRQALQWKPARFDLKTIVDDDWMRKEKAASQSGNT
jgi:UDP-glucose 4-epimerase